ncbi:MAG: CheR family methyltransferase [Actinomycetes bacterium]
MSTMLRDADFAAVRDYLAATAGLVFDESRRAGLAVVVAERLRASGAGSVSYYLATLATARGAAERERLLDRVTVQETYFFRNLPQMDALRRRILPDLLRRTARRERPLTIWSAGCSSGEEAYTLAMLVQDLVPRPSHGAGLRDERPAARILATDISAEALAVAERAVYSGRSLAAVPALERDRWFVPRAGRTMAVRDDVRRMVELRQHNLVTDPAPFGNGEVDLIVCRNVTIYFSRPTTRLLMGSFHDVLVDGGYLLLGHSETLWQVSDAFALVPVGEAFVYRRSGVGRRGRSVPPAEPAGRPRVAGVAQPTAPAPAPPRRRLRPALAVRRSPVPGAGPAGAGAAGAGAAGAAGTPPPMGPGQLDVARDALTGGDYREAVRLAELAIVAEPLLAEAYVVLGQARSTLGLDAEAVEPLRKAVYLDPAAGHAHFLLAGALARVGQHGAAAASYRAAARSLPSVSEPILRTFLGGRQVAELADMCERLARAATELLADGDVLASGRSVS